MAGLSLSREQSAALSFSTYPSVHPAANINECGKGCTSAFLCFELTFRASDDRSTRLPNDPRSAAPATQNLRLSQAQTARTVKARMSVRLVAPAIFGTSVSVSSAASRGAFLRRLLSWAYLGKLAAEQSDGVDQGNESAS